MFAVITKLSTVYDLNLPQVVSLSLSSEMANGGRPLFPGSDVDDQLRRIFKYPLLSVVHCPGIVCVVSHFSCCTVFDKGPTIWLLRKGMGNFRKKYPAEWFLGKKISLKEIPGEKIPPPSSKVKWATPEKNLIRRDCNSRETAAKNCWCSKVISTMCSCRLVYTRTF